LQYQELYNDTSNQPVIYVDSTISSGASTYQGSLLLQAGGAGSASYGAGLRLHGHAHASSPGSVEVGLSAVSGATFTVDSFGAGGGVDILKVERDNYNTTIAGNLVIGTASKGIDFSAAADVASGESTASSTLDDYEEGTWTPTVESSGGSVTCSSCSAGQYTKIGRQVIVHFQFTLTNSSSGSGTLKITNLPFSVNANSGAVIGAGRILDLGQTINVGHFTSTHQIGMFKYNGNYAGTDFFTNGFVTYFVA